MILIPFSSGLDSTTLVYNALEKKETFKLCYINITNNDDKSRLEKQQRSKIIKLFEKRYNTHISDNESIKVGIDCNRMVKLPQLPVWIMGLLYSIDTNVTEIRMGYCMNDDAVSFVSDIKRIWSAYQSVCEGKLPKLTFPLLKLKKIEYIGKLPNEIMQEVYFCESPISVSKESNIKLRLIKNKKLGLPSNKKEDITWKDCGYCGSCVRAKRDEIFLCYKRNNSLGLSEEHELKSVPESLFSNVGKAKFLSNVHGMKSTSVSELEETGIEKEELIGLEEYEDLQKDVI